MTTVARWMDAILTLLEGEGAHAALGHLRLEGRRLCPSAWRDRWWEQPIGLVEDDEAVAVDALEYAAALIELGAAGPARDLVRTVIRAAVGAVQVPAAAPARVEDLHAHH